MIHILSIAYYMLPIAWQVQELRLFRPIRCSRQISWTRWRSMPGPMAHEPMPLTLPKRLVVGIWFHMIYSDTYFWIYVYLHILCNICIHIYIYMCIWAHMRTVCTHMYIYTIYTDVYIGCARLVDMRISSLGWHWDLYVICFSLGSWCQVLGTKCLVPGPWDRVLGTSTLGTKYLVPITCYQVLEGPGGEGGNKFGWGHSKY